MYRKKDGSLAVALHPKFLDQISNTKRRKIDKVAADGRKPPRYYRWLNQKPENRLKYKEGKQELLEIVKAHYEKKK